jgi:hypothetical protein
MQPLPETYAPQKRYPDLLDLKLAQNTRALLSYATDLQVEQAVS